MRESSSLPCLSVHTRADLKHRMHISGRESSVMDKPLAASSARGSGSSVCMCHTHLQFAPSRLHTTTLRVTFSSRDLISAQEGGVWAFYFHSSSRGLKENILWLYLLLFYNTRASFPYSPPAPVNALFVFDLWTWFTECWRNRHLTFISQGRTAELGRLGKTILYQKKGNVCHCAKWFPSMI